MTQWLRSLLFLPDPASSFAARSDGLHSTIFLTTCAVALLIGLVGLVFLIRFRARAPAALTRSLVGPKWVEALFVLVPLGFFLAWFVVGYRDLIWVRTAPPEALDVYVMAKQWMWKFSYPEGPSAIGTLHVPVGRPVRLLITSRDVVHSFYVPTFRMKQDAVPGRYTELWFTAEHAGKFPVFCAEYCGLSHSSMRGEVVAMPPGEYRRWMDQQRLGDAARQDTRSVPNDGVGALGAVDPISDLRTQGERIAAVQGCLKCHSLDGTAHIGPTWLDLYGRAERLEGGGPVLADDAYLTESMMLPGAKVVAGFKPVMPTYQGKLQPGESAALIEFIKSLRSPRLPRTPTLEPVYVPR